jgi:hypothetical protein
VCVTIASALGLICQTNYKETSNGFWLVGSVFCVALGAASVPFFRHLDESRQASELDKYQDQVNDALEPLLHQSIKLSESSSLPLRHKHLSELVRASIETARHVVGQGRVRATYYRVHPHVGRARERLSPESHTGRGTTPQSVFAKGTPEGDHMFKVLNANGVVFVPDAASCDLPGWNPKRERDYSTFIAVPVRSKRKIYGMLTVDAPDVGDLRAGDVKFVKCVGLVLAAGIAMVLSYTPSSAIEGKTK